MSDLRPLLDEDATPFEAEILRSARARQPSPGATGRAMAALGIAGVATTAAGGAVAAPTALVLAKWVVVGALSAVCVLGGGQLASMMSEKASSVHPGERHESAAAAPVRASPIEPPRSPPTPSLLATQDPESAGPIAAAPAQPIPLRASPHAAPGPSVDQPTAAFAASPPPPVLDAEIALLDAARAAVGAHDPARALRVLDDHRRQFPSGQLSQEAAYVRVKALLELGQRAEAELTARRFLEAHPDSPHAKRIRALFGQ